MGEEHRHGRHRGRPGKLLIPGGGVARHIAELAILTGVDPLSLMRSPYDVVIALYDVARKISERRHGRHG